MQITLFYIQKRLPRDLSQVSNRSVLESLLSVYRMNIVFYVSMAKWNKAMIVTRYGWFLIGLQHLKNGTTITWKKKFQVCEMLGFDPFQVNVLKICKDFNFFFDLFKRLKLWMKVVGIFHGVCLSLVNVRKAQKKVKLVS